jgi:hypothetical protein
MRVVHNFADGIDNIRTFGLSRESVDYFNDPAAIAAAHYGINAFERFCRFAVSLRTTAAYDQL